MEQKSESSYSNVAMKSLDVLNLYPKHQSTLSSLLLTRIQNKECLVFENERTWNWENFHNWVAGLSDWLSKQNLKHGDKVALISRNNDLCVALLFALADQGLVFVPVNPDLNTQECAYVLIHS